MRRVVAVLAMVPMLTGCAFLARTIPPEASMPPGAPLVTMGYGPDGPVWPEEKLPPGEYRADWVNGCTASASLQGVTILTTEDPPTGSRVFTIEPNMDGTTFSSMCPPGASLVIEVRRP